MHLRKYHRVMAALVCGAVAACSASVSAFASDWPFIKWHDYVREEQAIENAADASYNIYIMQSEHGKISVDNETAKAGEEVLFHTNAESFYCVTESSLIILRSKIYADVPETPINFVSYDGHGQCTFSFIMPEEDVTIYGAFEEMKHN